MAQNVTTIIAGRRQALVKSWIANPLVQVQVEGAAFLPHLVFINDVGDGATLSPIGRRSSRNVALVRRPGDPNENASVWVAASYGGYQSAYLAFLKTVYGVEATVNDLAGYNVDHLLNRARAPQDTTFVRVEAIDADANQAWGRLFEKAASHHGFFANQRRERRTMSWMICAKLAGQMPPRGRDDTAAINRLVSFFERQGLSPAESRDGLQSMLNFAYSLR